MHSQIFHDRVNADLLDPNGDGWERIAHRRYHYLIEKIGEDAAEKWHTAKFPDGTNTTWKTAAIAMSFKLEELTEAAHTRIDRQQQAHPGIS